MDNGQNSKPGSRVAPSKYNAKRIALIVVAVVIVVLFALAAWWCGFYGRIYPGTSVNGIDVGGKTAAEAAECLRSAYVDNDGTVTVSLDGGVIASYDTKAYRVSNYDHDAAARETAERAVELSGKLPLGTKLAALFGGRNDMRIDAGQAYSEWRVSGDINALCAERSQAAVDGGYAKLPGVPTVPVTLGTPGVAYDAAALSMEVERRMSMGEFGDVDISGYAEVVEPMQPDLDALFAEVNVEAKDAQLVKQDDGTFAVEPEVVGWTFDLDAAKAKLAAGADFVILLDRTDPVLTSEMLNKELFKDLLSEVKTTLNPGEINRTGNVRLAAEAVNGTILAPGEEFSYNETVGERTVARGFTSAAVYLSGGIENQLGGGICQTSSTLYMAVIRSRLEITQRANHAYTVGYTPLGEDATVYWGSVDFKFRNNRDYPIKIVAEQKDNYVNVQIWGTDVDGYTVEISSVTNSYTPYETIEEEDPTLDFGVTKQRRPGHSGYSITTYATVLDANGQQVDYYKVADSRYTRLNRIVRVGTNGAPAVGAGEDVQPTPPTETTTPPVTTPPTNTTTPPTNTTTPTTDTTTPTTDNTASSDDTTHPQTDTATDASSTAGEPSNDTSASSADASSADASSASAGDNAPNDAKETEEELLNFAGRE